MPKLVWRVKLVAELEPGVTEETEVACLARGEEAGLADLGLRLDEAKQLTAALQAEMVSAQVAVVGERRRGCAACERPLASKGHYRATFRSLFTPLPPVTRIPQMDWHSAALAALFIKEIQRLAKQEGNSGKTGGKG